MTDRNEILWNTSLTDPVDESAGADADPAVLLLESPRVFNAWRTRHPNVAVDLSRRNLRGADLRNAFLVGAKMHECQLDDACLRDAVLSGATLDGASLLRADLRGAWCARRESRLDSDLIAMHSAMQHPASFRGAKLNACRMAGAWLQGADFRDADLTECNLHEANVGDALLEGATLSESVPADHDVMAVLVRLGQEPQRVREGMALFAALVFLAGTRNEDAQAGLVEIVSALGFTQDVVADMVPSNPNELGSIELEATSSHWVRRRYFGLMCRLVALSSSVSSLEVRVLSHFGMQLGFSPAAMQSRLQLALEGE